MDPGATYRNTRHSSYERLVNIVLAVLAVLSPLFINQDQESEPEVEEQGVSFVSCLPLLLLILVIAITFLCKFKQRFSRFSSYGKPVALGSAFLAVFSPLFVDRRREIEPEETEFITFASLLPLLLFLLILAISLSFYVDEGFSRFDPYWIHRVGGSSGGIMAILMVLAFVQKCKQLW